MPGREAPIPLPQRPFLAAMRGLCRIIPAMKPLAICLLLFAAPAFAESHEELIDRAFEALDDDLSEHWSYTHTQEDSEGHYVGRYDPRLPEGERWELISVDAREPTASETEYYLEQRRKEQDQDAEDDGGFESVAKEGSIALVEETDSFWLFSFEPVLGSEEGMDFMESVDGTLRVNKDGPYVAEMTLQNRRTIKPGKGVKIEKFFTRLAFAPVHQDGPVLPQSVEASVKGKAFLVVKFDETEKLTYSEFERVID